MILNPNGSDLATVVYRNLQGKLPAHVASSLACMLNVCSDDEGSKFTHFEALTVFDKMVSNFGVEYLRDNDDNAVFYSNTGETYATTLVYDIVNDALWLTSWGDFVEENANRFESGWGDEPDGQPDWQQEWEPIEREYDTIFEYADEY